MIPYYWVGGTGNLDDPAHWSLISGGVGGLVLPTLSDDAYFDNLSSNASYTVYINNNVVCQNLDIRNPSSGTVSLRQTVVGSKTLTIYGSIYTASGVILANITGSQTNGFILRGAGTRNLTTNGVQFPSMSFYGGAGLSCQDAFSHRSDNPHTVLMFQGQWYSNGFTQTLRSFQTSGSLAITADFTSSTVTCSNEWINQASNITMVMAGSTVTSHGRWYSGSLGGVKSTYDVVNDIPSTGITSSPIIDGGTFNSLNVTGYHWGSVNTPIGVTADILVNNQLTLNGLSAFNRLYFASSVQGTQRTITCNGTITASNVDMMDIIGAGSASWDLSNISGGSGDALGNQNITFTTGIDCYYRTTATTSYHSENKWYDAPTGGNLINRSPLPQDNPHMVANSFSGTGKTFNIDRNRLGNNIDWENVAYTPNINNQVECAWYGDIKLGNINWTGSQIMYTYGRGNHIIKCNGNYFPYTLNILSIEGTIELADNFFMKSTGLFFGVRTGTFISNGYTMDCPYYALSLRNGLVSLTLMSDVSNSTLKVRGAGTSLWTAPTGGQSTLNFTNTTIELLNASTGTFACGTNLAYNNIKFLHSSNVNMTATTRVTFNNIHYAPTQNATWTMMNTVPVWYNTMTGGGAPRALMTLQNTSGTATARLDKQIAGTDTVNYVVFRYIRHEDLNTLYAVNSYNIIGNVNIIFGEIPGRNKSADFFELM